MLSFSCIANSVSSLIRATTAMPVIASWSSWRLMIRASMVSKPSVFSTVGYKLGNNDRNAERAVAES